MNRGGKVLLIVIILVITISLFINSYKSSSSYICSDKYLSSKNEEERSVKSTNNNKNDYNYCSFEFEKFTGKWTIMEFKSGKNNYISIEDNSNIENGTFGIVVLDSNYNIIKKKIDFKENSNISFKTSKDEKYSIRLVGKNASGVVDIKVNAKDIVDIEHKEFFS
ncbi:hypothetical protein [Clostridium ihumii]|uniref:hypothetical protein n=1 Tax=Clostridium ihumii TaxID=1470356 RepID=UPI00054F5423|nr:hypothetical protein [Clostridium ihumii]